MRRIGVAEFQSAEYQRNTYFLTPEEGVTVDDLKRPECWAHVANKLREWDEIIVKPADRSFYARLLVKTVQPFSAAVQVLEFVEFERKAVAERAVEIPEGYEVVHRGRAGWSVKRLSDGAVLHQGAASKVDAASWLDQHLQKLAA